MSGSSAGLAVPLAASVCVRVGGDPRTSRHRVLRSDGQGNGSSSGLVGSVDRSEGVIEFEPPACGPPQVVFWIHAEALVVPSPFPVMVRIHDVFEMAP
jgi:hypothetical protein